jgi:hypothetical protein
VKVTEVPAHIDVPGLEPILTDGVTLAFTVMLAPVAVLAVVAVKQVPPAILMSHVIVCEPALKELLVYTLDAPV